jgi:hypothetical protein
METRDGKFLFSIVRKSRSPRRVWRGEPPDSVCRSLNSLGDGLGYNSYQPPVHLWLTEGRELN